MSIRRILVIVVPLLIVVIVIFYISLGGFKKPDIVVKETQGYILYGKRYTGKMDDKDLKATYKEIQKKYEDGELPGIFAVYHVHEPDQKEGRVDAVIGVIVKDSTTTAAKGYGYYIWEKGVVAEITIQSHVSVAPSPQEVTQFVDALAKSHGYKMGQGSLERYYDTDHLVIEIPLVKIE